MNAIIAVQDLIVQNQRRIKILKQQLRNHESGVIKLSPMSEASVELGLEKSQDVLEKNEIILKELQKKGLVEIEKEQSIKEAIIRRNYYKYQKVRLKRDLVMSNDQKLEAMLIIDELVITKEIWNRWQEILTLYQTYFVGITCNNQVLSERENIRKNRMIGSAIAQNKHIHTDKTYDLLLDSTNQSSDTLARITLKHLFEKYPL